jgi:hypothetical protein
LFHDLELVIDLGVGILEGLIIIAVIVAVVRC